MTEARTQLIRDPVHGLIAFEWDSKLDQLALKLIDTPEFQRLRRIKQLGVSEFVFPGAVHTRFAHCVGVFHVARKLIKIIERELNRLGKKPDKDREEVAVIAALLHDLGHGPFSHTFEGVQAARGSKRRHEVWTADIIRRPDGGLWPLLEGHRRGFGEDVAAIFGTETPKDIYHAVVSSSFDADRLDYLRRDKLMTGSGAGAIDFDWLLEHARIGTVRLDPADENDEDGISVTTFCFDKKAQPAAEQFLLARYTMHEQVYFHKTTRCIEKMISTLLRAVSEYALDLKTVEEKTGLPARHPLIQFFTNDGETVQNYLKLDDALILGALSLLRQASNPKIALLAGHIQDRKIYKTLDIASVRGSDDGSQAAVARRIDENFAKQMDEGSVIKDHDAKISIYTRIGGDEEKIHKKIHILDPSRAREIVDMSDLVRSLTVPKVFRRYYFESESDRDQAKKLKGTPK